MQPGEVVAKRFEIERVAGAGGMGVVYRALDRQTGELVALKVQRSSAAEHAARFAREASVLAEVLHPGIVAYRAHGLTDEGAPWLAMEWLEGEDLAARLGRGRLDLKDALALGGAVASALSALHSRGVVHRDVKPSNVFLCDRDPLRPKLLDLGIVKARRATQVQTRTGAILGSPGYMAPEQARGDHALDARADVFSLGCVLYECVTGQPAFAGEHVMALLAKILLEEPPRASERCEGIPPALDELLLRMLSKDPQGRLADGAAVERELAGVDLSAPPQPRAPSLWPRSSEQHIVSVLLLADPFEGGTLAREGAQGSFERAATLPAGEPASAPWRVLSDVAAAQHVRLEQLAEGSIVGALESAGAATDQAARAARCALAMRALMPSLRIALATGRSSSARRAPVGEVIDRAARLLAREPAIRVDEVTAGLLDLRFDLDGDAQGLSLRAERDVAEAGRTLLGKPTACVGRDRELAHLLALFDEAVFEPAPRAALVVAPAGVGKSRLRHELVRRIAESGRSVEIWIAGADPLAAGSPYGLLAQAIRRAARLIEGEPVAVARQKLRSRVARHVADVDRARVAEFVGELVGVPAFEVPSVELVAARRDALLMRDQIARALEEWLAAECAVGPQLVVLEDLHWGDLPTIKVVGAALRNLAGQPLFVLALARPEALEAFPALASDWAAELVHLKELGRAPCERIVREALGESAASAVVERVVRRSGGNAFYLEELVRSVAERGDDALPDTVIAMLQGRLERMEEGARLVLRAASIFGETFRRAGVLALLGGDGASIDRWLAELTAREVITPAAREPGADARHAFRHGLVRDAAYALLADEDRRAGHALAAAWLEAAGERSAVVLAEHLERAGEPQRAVGSYLRAAEQALEGDDLAAAIARVERGKACGAAGAVLGLFHLVELEARVGRGENDLAHRAGGAAWAALPPGSTSFYAALGKLATARGRMGDRLGLEEVAAELGVTRPDPSARGAHALAAARAFAQLLFLGCAAPHAPLLDDAQAYCRAIDDPGVEAWLWRALFVRALTAGERGSLPRIAEAATSAFERAGDVRNATGQRVNVGFAYAMLGAYERAEVLLRDALAIARRMELYEYTFAALNNLGFVRAAQGAIEEACVMEEEAIEMAIRQVDRRREGGSRIYLAQALAMKGELESAEREARRAIEVLAVAPPMQVLGYGVLSGALVAQGRWDEALASADRGLALATRLGDIEQGDVELLLARSDALLALGRGDEAHATLGRARGLVQGRAEGIDDPVLRESFVRVRMNARALAAR